MHKRMKLNRRDALAVLLTAAVIAFLFCSGVLNRRAEWNLVPVLRGAEYAGTGIADGGRNWSAAADGYGSCDGVYNVNLDRGVYRLSWRIEGDGVNRICLSAGNDARIQPAAVETAPDNPEGSAEITLAEAIADLNVSVEFASGQTMTLYSLSLTSPAYTDDAWTVSLILAAVLLLFLLAEHGVLGPEGLKELLLMGFAVLVMSHQNMVDYVNEEHDLLFHGARFLNLKDGLLDGQFPVRMGSFSYNGYGAVTSVFYPDLFLYPFALMMAGGASFVYAVNAWGIAMNIISAAAMYVCVMHMFHERRTAVCASLLYICAEYRICNIYIRNAAGEVSAMAFLPLFMAGLWEVFFGDRDQWPLLGAGAALIMQSHLISTMLTAVLAAGMGLYYLPRLIREKRILPVVKAVVLAGLLCVSFIVPFLHYSLQGVNASALQGNCERSALSPAQLFLWAGGDYITADKTLCYYPTVLSLPLLMGVFLLFRHAFLSGKPDRDTRGALLLTVLGVISGWMVTNLFPWEKLGILTRGVSQYVQYPFRLLVFATLLLSPAAAYGFMHTEHVNEKRTVLFVAAFSVLYCMNLITDLSVKKEGHCFQFGEITTPAVPYVEYLPPNTDSHGTKIRAAETEGDVQISGYVKQGTDISCTVVSAEGGSLTLPLFNFDGYDITLGGQTVPPENGGNSRIRLTIPAGTDAQLRVHYVGKAIWHLFDAVSALAALAALRLLWKRRRHGVLFAENRPE